MKDIMDRVINKGHLTEEEMMDVMDTIMSGRATPSQIGGFLVALRMKGETVDEIVGSVRAMKDKALRVNVNKEYAIDTCGTGGDGANTFNISTTVAFVAAAAGVAVVKHGNRSVSSRCGSTDVLEMLGANINLTAAEVEESVEAINIGFMYAPNFHKAMKHAVAPRRELGIRTIFNILGPLINPANVQGQVLGVFSPSLTEVIGKTLKELGTDRAMVVHGLDGLDEITLTRETKVTELRDNKIYNYTIDPRKYKLPLAAREELQGGSPKENAQIIVDILKGEKGARRNIVLLNAGAAIYVGKKAGSLEEGIYMAREVIDKGLALDKLNEFISFSRGIRQ